MDAAGEENKGKAHRSVISVRNRPRAQVALKKATREFKAVLSRWERASAQRFVKAVTPCPLFQVLVDRLGHLKHVQFLTAKDRLQLIVGQDFSFVLRILKVLLLNVRPNLFCDFTSR